MFEFARSISASKPRRIAIGAACAAIALGTGLVITNASADSAVEPKPPMTPATSLTLKTAFDRMLGDASADPSSIAVAARDSKGVDIEGAGKPFGSAYADIPAKPGANGYRLYISRGNGDEGVQSCDAAKAMGAISCTSEQVKGGTLVEAVYVHMYAGLGQGKYTWPDRPVAQIELANLRVQHMVEFYPVGGGKSAAIETVIAPTTRNFEEDFTLTTKSLTQAVSGSPIKDVLDK